MRILKASVICSTVLLLTVAHAVEKKSNPAPQQGLQAAEASSQETVRLAISGMT
jgi:secreted Zn-dependent insulinase-like peptidase